MAGIFFLLFLASTTLLITGLIKPSLFTRVIKKILSRKQIFVIFSGLTLFFFIMIGLTAPQVEKQDQTKYKQNIVTQLQNQPNVSTTDTPTIQTNSNVATVTTQPSSTAINIIPPTPVIQQNSGVVATSSGKNIDNTVLYAVTGIVDGDTIKISVDGKIQSYRLIGMDTPEVADPRKVVQCFGKEASAKAKELLSGKKVRIETEPNYGEYDIYGRPLAYIFREDGLFYNKYMIEQGYAHEYTYKKPYKYQTEFKTAQKSAQDNLRGFWSPTTCNGDTTQSAITTSTTTQTTTGNTSVSSEKYYTSSYYRAKYYYPAACTGWQGLSKDYLKVFNSLSELLKAYPSRVISPEC